MYYFARDGQLVFASELRAILRTGMIPRRLSSQALSGYLLFGAVPEPMTLLEGVSALPAGHYLLWRDGKVRLTKYWDVHFGDEPLTEGVAVELVRSALEETIGRHLVSDVPVGVFLSGGIDSTAIVALASKRVGRDLRTFSISFDDPAFNEGDVAAQTAQHFGTQHTDWRLDSSAAKKLLREFLLHSDQPSIDGFNTFCVSKLAHDHGVKVVLSGLGGDELFGGYGSFKKVPQMIGMSRAINLAWPLRTLAGTALQTSISSPRVSRFGHFLTGVPSTASAYWAMRGVFTPREVARLLPRYGVSSASDRRGGRFLFSVAANAGRRGQLSRDNEVHEKPTSAR